MLTLYLFSSRSTDAIGDGVMRQVLSEAIRVTSERTCQDIKTTEDSYVYLQVKDFPDAAVEDYAFALGVLCTMFFLRVHSAPLPVSPALLQATIGGIDSVVDSAWLAAVLPDTFNLIKLFPSSFDAAQDTSHLNPKETWDLQRILHHVGKQSVRCLFLFFEDYQLTFTTSSHSFHAHELHSGQIWSKLFICPYCWVSVPFRSLTL